VIAAVDGGSSPHIWGQANASKVLLNSLIAEKSSGQVILGRGIPNDAGIYEPDRAVR
jgi:hypothetical protein